VPMNEIEIAAVRASGPGGQHVNKAATAAHLRFDIHASSLPEAVKARLARRRDHRINRDGVLVIKAQTHRSLARNRDEALSRLKALIVAAARPAPKRKATRPSRAAKRKRVERKVKRGRQKALRGRVDPS